MALPVRYVASSTITRPGTERHTRHHFALAEKKPRKGTRSWATKAERASKEERRRSLALRTELDRERSKHAKALEAEAERTAAASAAAAEAKAAADKLARRERRLLEQQSQWADAQLLTKKGREEVERLTSELDEVKHAARAQERRHKMETERLRTRGAGLASRIAELEGKLAEVTKGASAKKTSRATPRKSAKKSAGS